MAIAALAIAAGCTSPPETRYYTLRPLPTGSDMSSIPVPAPFQAAVLIDRFVVDEAYQDVRLCYRSSANELGYDPYSRWAGTPAAQVEDAVRELIRDARLFRDVRQAEPVGLGRSSYDFVITGRVGRLEEVDAGDQWYAELEIELMLLDGKSREVLHSTQYSKSMQAAKRNPPEVVASLSLMLKGAVATFANEVKPIVAAKRGR